MKQFILGFLIFSIPIANMAAIKTAIIVNYQGINCQYCTYRMKNRLYKLLNVEQVNITPSRIKLIIPTVNNSDFLTIEKIIRDAGYIPDNPTVIKTD